MLSLSNLVVVTKEVKMARLGNLQLTILLASCLAPLPCFADAEADSAALTATIAALDTQVFDAYNGCDLEAFANFFSPSVEFYHDTGGATFNWRTVVANTRKYICNKVRREIIPASLKVFPIKDFGAIEEGEHRFCQTSTGACEGVAKFVMIWRRTGTRWQITRVLSYGHRALLPNEQ
jgi:hypothetical protein